VWRVDCDIRAALRIAYFVYGVHSVPHKFPRIQFDNLLGTVVYPFGIRYRISLFLDITSSLDPQIVTRLLGQVM